MSNYVSPNQIRRQFSTAMSQMYQQEVPLYSELMSLVSEVNNAVLAKNSDIKQQLESTGELERLDIERHGAIRLGLASELSQMRRLFAVMGMSPVGYYDLVPAGVPVHSTAFRAVNAEDLHVSPFRIFTSLLRLELITDPALRKTAEDTLNNRQIFTPRVLELIEKHEQQGGLNEADATEFVKEALETFRWHEVSPVSEDLYHQLNGQHRLIADIVGFKGPHINHLTPRTLDIDAVQVGMAKKGIPPKAIIEGPPPRRCPILLRQTSFKALQENIKFNDNQAGQHTARFGEIEQRGVAVTAKGRQLYDEMLENSRQTLGVTPDESNAEQYMQVLTDSFADFPDDYRQMYEQGLAYFYLKPNLKTSQTATSEKLKALFPQGNVSENDIPNLLDNQLVTLEPIVYEDFLPVSAAGIFQSNLGEDSKGEYQETSTQALFEQALGEKVIDSDSLYQATQDESVKGCLGTFNRLF